MFKHDFLQLEFIYEEKSIHYSICAKVSSQDSRFFSSFCYSLVNQIFHKKHLLMPNSFTYTHKPIQQNKQLTNNRHANLNGKTKEYTLNKHCCQLSSSYHPEKSEVKTLQQNKTGFSQTNRSICVLIYSQENHYESN